MLRSGVRGTKILTVWLLFMANVVFLCFFTALLYSYEIQTRLTDISMYKSGLYSISLGFGAALALLGMLGGQYVWLVSLDLKSFDVFWLIPFQVLCV